jgi:phosphomannomutase
MTELIDLAKNWLAQDPDPSTRAELQELIENNDSTALAERFSSRLEFGTAGLRGALGAGSNRMNRVLVGQAAAGLGRYLGAGSSVVIGFDGRLNSDVFAKDSAEILAGMGLKVFLVDGYAPTPLISFATRYLGVSAGIMVTASHNPRNDNGYKLYLGGSFQGSQIISPVDSDIEKEIEYIAEHETFQSLSKSNNYSVIGEDLREAYLLAVLNKVPKVSNPKLKIVYTPMHGVGYTSASKIFDRAGFNEIIPVIEQMQPDGRFPTVEFPNPEEKGALDLAKKLAEETKADLIVANDPDADRVAIAVKTETGFKQLTGDEVGLILGDYIASKASSGTLACSIVSSSALAEVAKVNNLNFVETLTGFKWISKVPNLIFGYEEALGYCIDPDHVADKDGLSAALLLASIAESEAARGKTLLDRLEALRGKYGYFATGQISIRFSEISKIGEVMRQLRANPVGHLNGENLKVTDFSLGEAGLPSTDALRYELEDQSRVIIRPSGTEPKLKCYLQVKGSDSADATKKLDLLTKSCRELLANFD